MLVAIEGIDGAGKTHVARKLVLTLNNKGYLARYLNKSDIVFGDPFTDSRLQLLKNLLWPQQGEPRVDMLGTHFYLFLLAAWFSAVGQLLRREPGGARSPITVMDGSHFRVVAKAHCRAKIDPSQLLGYFDQAAKPDLVVLLQIDPAVSWQRRTTFKETEIGRWDGYRGNAQQAYCAYQTTIQDVLQQMARTDKWLVIPQNEMTRDSDIVGQIIQHIATNQTREPQRQQTPPMTA